MHKMEFDRAYCKDLLNRILRKFTWYFSKVCEIFYKFYICELISEMFKGIMKLEIQNGCTMLGPNRSKATMLWLDSPQLQPP
jgi:hypothetical protein